MTNDQVLAEAIRAWVAQELPGERGAADRAAHVGQTAYRRGASVTDAFGAARSFVGSWVRHPSHRAKTGGTLPLAS